MPSAYACPPLPYFFSKSTHKRRELRRKKNATEHEICVLIFSTTLSEKLLVLRRIRRDTIITHIGTHVKYPLFLSDFIENWVLSTYFGKYSNPVSGRRVVPCDRQTDRHRGGQTWIILTATFRNFAKAPKGGDAVRHLILFSVLPNYLRITETLYPTSTYNDPLKQKFTQLASYTCYTVRSLQWWTGNIKAARVWAPSCTTFHVSSPPCFIAKTETRIFPQKNRLQYT